MSIYECFYRNLTETVVADEGVSQEALRVLPHPSAPHLHTHLVPAVVVRLTKVPVPVVALFVAVVTAV